MDSDFDTDFDDLLALWLKLLQEHEEARERYQRKFQFILVDEYQDTNRQQYRLARFAHAAEKRDAAIRRPCNPQKCSMRRR